MTHDRMPTSSLFIGLCLCHRGVIIVIVLKMREKLSSMLNIFVIKRVLIHVKFWESI